MSSLVTKCDFSSQNWLALNSGIKTFCKSHSHLQNFKLRVVVVMVSMIAFFSNDPSSNTAKAYDLRIGRLQVENK